MTCIIDTKSKRHLSLKLAAGLAISAVLVLGTVATSASAEGRRDDHRGGDHRGYRGDSGWTGGYYSAPPVVYAPAPYYGPPPVVYGPGIGINIGIR
jgi:hypothetical protein